nr:ABC transporter permease [uncultured Marinifilum sp.]
MLSFFAIQESWEVIKQHKNRNLLTGFGVAWGIFILLLLVGTGSGLQKGIMVIFQDYSQNSIWVYGGRTSLAKPGQHAGRQIRFTDKDLNLFKKRFDEIRYISPEIQYSGEQVNSKLQSYHRFKCYGVKNEYFQIKTFKIEKGRLINPIDNRKHNKVAVIGKKIVEGLFEDTNPIGQYICLDGVWLQVIGVLSQNSLFSSNPSHIYVPIETLKDQFGLENNLNCFSIALNSDSSPETFEKKLKNFLARKYNFNSEDKNALYVENMQVRSKTFNNLFRWINFFLWIVGISILSSGIVGVSNIMLVIVKERTVEIGIRKSIGASPWNIRLMILNESILITFLAGLVGIICSTGTIWIINALISAFSNNDNALFKGLEINFTIALTALLLLTISGTLAGLYPARKASSMLPVKALNSINN